MAKDDLIKFDGIVVDVFAGGKFQVELDNGKVVTARIAGKMRQHHIRVIRGDRVTVGLSPYDISHGLILSRERTNHRPPAQKS